MSWALYITIAGVLNAFTNLGYKLYSRNPGIYYYFGGALGIAAVLLYLYGTTVQGQSVHGILTPRILAIGLAMGVATPLVFGLMFKAFAKAGPLSLVDPLWACLYSLWSVILGIKIGAEAPSAAALSGIVLYVIGAFLMAKGNKAS